MRRSLYLAAALISLVSCSSKTQTSLRLTVDFDAALSLDQLRLRVTPGDLERLVPDPPGTVRQQTRVVLLIPDGWVDTTLTVEVSGIAGGAELVRGQVAATPKRGEVVELSITLSAPCKSTCVAGETRCQSGQIRVCQLDTQNCATFNAPESCPPAQPVCSGGTCVDKCSDQCTDGQRRCRDSGYQICGKSEAGCLDWGPVIGCNSEEICRQSDGQCVLDCGGKPCPCKPAETAVCPDKGECHGGKRTCGSDGTFGECSWQIGPQAELCDGKDNDCSGTPDDNLLAPACDKQLGVCKGSTKKCGGTAGWLVCADSDYATYAQSKALTYEATETQCDAQDNDCNGNVDEPATCCKPDCTGKACNADDGCGGKCNSPGCLECVGPADCASSVMGGACTANKCTCGGDADCATAASAHSWGNKCGSWNPTRCGCDSNADCTGNPNGPSCHTSANKCTCSSDSDCKVASYTKCQLTYVGAKYSHCEKPCTSDAECLARTNLYNGANAGFKRCSGEGKCVLCAINADCSGATPVCGPNGTCVECLVNGDCPAFKPVCGAQNTCLECSTNTDCASSPWGRFCDNNGQCSCNSESDCTGASAGYGCWIGSAGNHCGCSENSECQGNPLGPTCFFGPSSCSCSLDTECTVSPYSQCDYTYGNAPPYGAENLRWCSKSCTSDAECVALGRGHRRCDNSKCVGCRNSTDCASEPKNKACETVHKRCVECVSNADCTPSSAGGRCTTDFRCICTADENCATNLNGKVCMYPGAYGVCGCKSDLDCLGSRKCVDNPDGWDKTCI